MLSASDAAIAFAKEQCRDLHDMLLWLRYENFVLTRNCCGYESKDTYIHQALARYKINTHTYTSLGYRTWARSGRLINDLCAMDIHRDPEMPQASDTPWFLREIQTRLFACMYEADKSLSRVLGKLPRLPRQYCNRRLPLKISDGTSSQPFSRRKMRSSICRIWAAAFARNRFPPIAFAYAICLRRLRRWSSA
jgi:hypothetical protein